MASKFSMFAQKTKDLEAKSQGSSNTIKQNQDPVVPAKEKNPDDLEIQ